MYSDTHLLHFLSSHVVWLQFQLYSIAQQIVKLHNKLAANPFFSRCLQAITSLLQTASCYFAWQVAHLSLLCMTATPTVVQKQP